MQFYKVWKKDEEKGINYLVAAVDSEQAKSLVVKYTEYKVPKADLRIGFATKFDSDWITVWKVTSGYGYGSKRQSTAWEEWESCKRADRSKVITEVRP